ncbi:hypothetical protein MIND_01195200 [Mycena indigotica]|uniref:F-box domain-containing protein n=1 Tax=Mycena indigotica TaxID=2126181 RepID=A0A8H6S7Y8_9AGAR|nr:uncharacterized protein MIND_01195200 [Mycena indigotica]KAF7292960.1 hypothetical protein MIND_01195200 [Mycena indigotica]
MSLVQLNNDVLLLICLELPLDSVHSLRQVSRVFDAITRVRSLWLTFLRRILNKNGLTPSYLGHHEDLDTPVLERLVQRLGNFADKWGSDPTPISPATLIKYNTSLSVTWLKLVAGNWLFVASSDEEKSKISCYDLSVATLNEAAHAYLPGRVRTGQVEIKTGSIVLALGLESECAAVHILTLCKVSGRRVFCELARFQGSTHVLMLSGSLVGCAIRNGSNVPHLCDWTSHVTYEIAAPPDGLDIPSRRTVPHKMLLWQTKLVIIRSSEIELYDVTVGTDTTTVSFDTTISTPSIWEAERCFPPGRSSDALHILALSSRGLELIMLTAYSGQVEYHQDPLLEAGPRILEPDESASWDDFPMFFGLHIGGSGQRVLWISAAEATIFSENPHLRLCQGALPPTFSGDTAMQQLSTTFADMEDPAIWGVASIDFDDALGIVVIGNCFGELTVYDFASERPIHHPPLFVDMTERAEPLPTVLPLEHLPLNKLPAPHYRMSDIELASSRASRWGQDNINAFGNWKKPMCTIRHGFSSQHFWEGVPCDFGWVLDHVYGFPGEVLLQSIIYQWDAEGEEIIFRIGDRYLLVTTEKEEHYLSWSLDPGRFTYQPNHPQSCVPQLPTCETARAVQTLYARFLSDERNGRGRPARDRWVELVARGGKPPD